MRLVSRIRRLVHRQGIARLPVSVLKAWVRRKSGVLVLGYHSISDGDAYPFSTGKGAFARHMAVLREVATPIRLDQIAAVDDRPGLKVVVTFDDGFRNNYECAWPILRRYAVPFTVFIATGFVDSGRSSFMTWHQVRELADSDDAIIGAHTIIHANLLSLGKTDQAEEIAGSAEVLADRIGQRPTLFAYPGGYSDGSSRAVAKSTYWMSFKDRTDGQSDHDPARVARVILRREHDPEKAFLVALATTTPLAPSALARSASEQGQA